MKARFRSELEILTRIDRYKVEIKSMNMEAALLEDLSIALRPTKEFHRIPSIRKEIAELESRVARRLEFLALLKQRLAEFRTATLPGICDGDESVPRL